MITRLGNVLYWAGCVLAAVVLALGAWVSLEGREVGYVLGAAIGLAAIIWLVGRACRYVLAGN
jgi:hypothetical protein